MNGRVGRCVCVCVQGVTNTASRILCESAAVTQPWVIPNRPKPPTPILGLESHQHAIWLRVPGITNTAGRILAGFLADLKCVNALLLHNTALICAGLLCFADVLCRELVSMCLFATLFGFCIGKFKSSGFPRLPESCGIVFVKFPGPGTHTHATV